MLGIIVWPFNVFLFICNQKAFSRGKEGHPRPSQLIGESGENKSISDYFTESLHWCCQTLACLGFQPSVSSRLSHFLLLSIGNLDKGV